MLLGGSDTVLDLVAALTHLDVDEGDDLGGQSIFGSLYYYDKFLAHLRSDFERKGLLQLLGNRILDEPAVELDFGILDLRSVLVVEGELISIVLPEYGIAVVGVVFGYTHGDNLVFVTNVAEQES